MRELTNKHKYVSPESAPEKNREKLSKNGKTHLQATIPMENGDVL